jgi:hypothetical protein
MNLAILKPQSLTRFSLQKDLGFECFNNAESFHTLSARQFGTKLSSPYAAMFKRASAAYIVRCVKSLPSRFESYGSSRKFFLSF